MINKAIISGRVGRKPELKKTSTGKSYVQFSVATDETWKDNKGVQQVHTDWHDIKAWGKLAEAIGTYVVQGQELDIIGKNRVDIVPTDEVVNGKTKNKYYKYILAQTVEFGAKPKAYWDAVNAQKNGQPAPQKPAPAQNKLEQLQQLQAQLAEITKQVAALGGVVAQPQSPPDTYEEPDYATGYEEPEAPPQQAQNQARPDLEAGL